MVLLAFLDRPRHRNRSTDRAYRANIVQGYIRLEVSFTLKPVSRLLNEFFKLIRRI
jgi:hypothetical protein